MKGFNNPFYRIVGWQQILVKNKIGHSMNK